MSDEYALALKDVCSAWSAAAPPTRMRVSEGAAANLYIKVPGGTAGPWNPLLTPYMVEPCDMLASRRHSAVCFVGPARTGKTVALVDGWFAHAVVNDPGDMAIFQMTQDKAREYVKSNIDRAIRNSPNLRAMKSVSSRDDNMHDKTFRNGMMLKIAWPTAANLSSSTYRYTAGTDYDRWNGGREDVDNEGDGFGLMVKRTATLLSRGMTVVESSPGRLIVDPSWKPGTPHEAPPVGTVETGSGILGIYNRGDRRRLYWQCPHCGEPFEAAPGLGLFRLPEEDSLLEDIRDIDIDTFARQYAKVACPQGCVITADHKERMNRGVIEGRGGWLADGLTMDSRGRISGTPRTSTIASYWLGGVAATYTSWDHLIRKYLQALLEYHMTGNELPLQTTINTDQGMPYMSRHLVEAARQAKQGRRVEHGMQRFLVPEWARFLIASVDVQGGKHARFVVQVHAVGEHKRQQLVDRYSITRSPTRQGMADGEMAPIDPAAYAEDWDALTLKVIDATFPIEGMDGLEMKVRRTYVDSGGEDGVTDNAYAWYRRLRRKNKQNRVRLTKGANSRPEWHTKETWVGGRQGSGDIPLLMFEPNKFKDMVYAGLKRATVGPGYYHFPEPRGPGNPDGWLAPAFFDELNAEVRGPDGVWKQIKPRNESFDLCALVLVGCRDLGVDRARFWDAPPSWALPAGSNNDYVVTVEQRRLEKQEPPPPAQPQAPRLESPGRRVRRSTYLD